MDSDVAFDHSQATCRDRGAAAGWLHYHSVVSSAAIAPRGGASHVVNIAENQALPIWAKHSPYAQSYIGMLKGYYGNSAALGQLEHLGPFLRLTLSRHHG